METLLQQFINSLTIGTEYALIALGYTMVFGVLRLINFAHGDVYMIGAYIGAYAAQALNRLCGHHDTDPIPLYQAPLIILAAMLFCGSLGYLIERFAYRPLRGRSKLSALITAIGVSLLLENLVQFELPIGRWRFFGPNEVTFPAIAGLNTPIAWITHTSGLSVIPRDLLEFLTSAAALLVLWYIVKRTRIGKAMRAVSQNYDASQLMGININRVVSFTFVLGSVLAALGACLFGFRASKVTYDMGISLGLKAFIAAVIGGIGNIPGAAAGGFLLGILETLVSSLHPLGFSLSPYRDAVAFFFLILVLLLKPEGLLGQALPEKV